MKLEVIRKSRSARATLGELHVGGAFECFTLEDAVREIPGATVEQWKAPGATAIPAGQYAVTVDFSVRFGREMPHILDVPGFAGIRIHSGNTDQDTEGCILLGRSIGGPDLILHSRDAFAAFFPKLKAALDAGEEVTVSVVNQV
jgi:hypothetical protein